jgi:hypothetical protein
MKSTNEILTQLFSMISNIEAVKNVATPSTAPALPVTTVLSISHTLRIKLGVPNNFDRD